MKNIVYVLISIVILSCKGQDSEPKEELPSISFKQVEDVQLSSGKLLRAEVFPSKHVAARNVDVWLPDSYSEEKKYAVLYMHDGQMLFDATTTWNKQEWMVDEHASALMKNKTTRDFIVVALWNVSELRHSDYFPQKPFESLTKKTQDSLYVEAKKYNIPFKQLNADSYLKFIVEEVQPVINRNFSVLTGPENTFVAGSSMGGLISMYAVSEYPNVFGGAACLSTHWIGTYSNKNNPIPKTFFDYMETTLPTSKTHKIYFDYGTKTLDALYLPYQETVTQLIKGKGHQHNKAFEGHDHSELAWQSRLQIPLEFLLKE